MSDLMPSEKPQPIQTATGDQMYTVQKTSLARDHEDVGLHGGLDSSVLHVEMIHA